MSDSGSPAVRRVRTAVPVEAASAGGPESAASGGVVDQLLESADHALGEAVDRVRELAPEVEVTASSQTGSPSRVLVDAAQRAALVVVGASLAGAEAQGASFVRANLTRADLSGAELHGVNFNGANLFAADLSDSEMFGTTLANVRAAGADFSDAEITASNLSNGDFSGADFSDASLDGARLTGGRFHRADFSDASMRRTDIRGADLSGARGLTQDQVDEACADGSTRLPGRLTVRTCRGGPRLVRTPPTPPVPPRVRNLVVASEH